MLVTATPQMPVPAPSGTGPGKSDAAPGQIAKDVVAQAKAAGADLPKNAQGMAASQIAQGADPESVFSAIIPVAEPVEAEDQTPPANDSDSETPVAVAGYADAVEVVSDAPMTAEETALAILV